ncbi:hypothetical protein [Sciscionella sediminilitoris]|uniref:hypothetical protein n=1 Tax=Sciscionella sediminilitoris TaxID=1445613 RepID=UPI0004DF1596|nr:hypothetical protein [Sciscionella sp. SE31]
MKRLFWLGVGVTAGVIATRKVNATARKATPAGIGENIGAGLRELAEAVGAFGADVRAGMSEREEELARGVTERTGVELPGRRARGAGERAS